MSVCFLESTILYPSHGTVSPSLHSSTIYIFKEIVLLTCQVSTNQQPNKECSSIEPSSCKGFTDLMDRAASPAHTMHVLQVLHEWSRPTLC